MKRFVKCNFLFIDALSFGRGTDRQEERKGVDAACGGLNPPLQDGGDITPLPSILFFGRGWGRGGRAAVRPNDRRRTNGAG